MNNIFLSKKPMNDLGPSTQKAYGICVGVLHNSAKPVTRKPMVTAESLGRIITVTEKSLQEKGLQRPIESVKAFLLSPSK